MSRITYGQWRAMQIRAEAAEAQRDQLATELRRTVAAAVELASELPDPGPEALTAIHCAYMTLGHYSQSEPPQ